MLVVVVTIVVLLILAGITITYVIGDNGIFKRAAEVNEKADIAKWQERLETAKMPVIIEELGKFNPDKYFKYIEELEIIEDKETDIVDNGNGTYDVTTKSGYIFEIELIPNKEEPRDAKIEYIGQAGKIAPIIKKIEVSATSTSITAKAIVIKLGNGTIEYYYKQKTENDSAYKQITNVNEQTGATQETGITGGTEYIIKVVAKNEAGEVEKTAEITATKVFVESITLNKTAEIVTIGKTETLIATVKPDNSTNKSVIWTSSNPDIATVSNTGEIKAKSVGNITITVTTTDGSNKTAMCNVTVKSELESIVGEIQTSNRIVTDNYGNKVTIPAGFKVVANGGTEDTSKVDYTYSGDGSPCVQDGIVIEDGARNQFVWIPVGNIKNKDNTIATITLGRYTFDSTNGTQKLEQNADNYMDVVTIGSYYEESGANVKEFISKTKENGGYYFARYEASQGSNNQIKSQANLAAWTDITKTNAVKAAREMYNSSCVESDLMNSYSWDTAIAFIQKYSMNTRTAQNKICNIYFRSSVSYEWNTEFSTYSFSTISGPHNLDCVLRTKNFNSSNVWSNRYSVTSEGYCNSGTIALNTVSFRLLCYLK